MLRRIFSALILIPITLLAVFYAPPLLYLAILGILGSICLHEYFHLTRRMGFRGQPWFGHPCLWFLLIGLHEQWLPADLACAIVVLGAFLAAMWRRDPMKDRAAGLMSNLLGIFYLAAGFYSALAVRFDFGARAGLEWTIVLLASVWAGDTAALLGGKSLGRTRFAPRLSPNKTNEGAVCGLLAGIGAAILLQQSIFPGISLPHVFIASLLIGIFGQLGDLAESMLKRAAETKESSHLIPGHGGVLDRVDSLLFAFPVLYLLLQLLHSA